MNGSAARIRFAASWGSSVFLCTACAGSSAVASTCIEAPSSPSSNAPTVPPGWYVIVAVRFAENSSGLAMTSLIASQPETAWKLDSPIRCTGPAASMRR